MEKINLTAKFNLFNEQWTPKIIAELNGQQVKIAKVKGEFVWHDHANEDELFMVIKGQLTILQRNGSIQINEGEIYVVPKGVQHKPIAEKECWILLFEPKATKHTGEVVNEKTVGQSDWI